MNHRTWTVVCAGLLALALGVLGATLPVPLVALGPGPTFNTLGEVDGTMVVAVKGLPTYPTAGNLNMTTVSVTDRLTLFNAIGFWAARDHQVVPRDTVFPPDKSAEQVQQENTDQFASSEANAEVAALTDLKLPTRVVVSALTAGSPATGRLQPGDELVTVAGKAVSTPQQVSDALTGTKPGQSVVITYKRDGKQADATVVLGANPSLPQGFLGVRPGIEPLGGDITISLGDIGGPSAGLMFTLAVIDKLTPGELNGGRFIAGTGTIDPDGTVGPIGGIPFKMMAARAAGATTFLVPAANCAEAAANDPDGLSLVRVGTLGDALTALDALRANKPVVGC
ncbi:MULTISPECIES: PDZ domain-containing protein [unclassified Pseudonocardia]|uniref:YlbL family protein n=1 Tax=unclassified Pseudonocardia TaxID=2619320 RepID=UPI00095ED0A8|nr:MULTISPECIES: PDZ domain-containing protein [unclassified Pseudonocardia]MBN9099708.1 PDZ domain-containing protein [Pseudonocardia sp.]OJY45210.1 MAG: signal protein PDZ [Pseudonocardia sp. 73-21]